MSQEPSCCSDATRPASCSRLARWNSARARSARSRSWSARSVSASASFRAASAAARAVVGRGSLLTASCCAAKARERSSSARWRSASAAAACCIGLLLGSERTRALLVSALALSHRRSGLLHCFLLCGERARALLISPRGFCLGPLLLLRRFQLRPPSCLGGQALLFGGPARLFRGGALRFRRMASILARRFGGNGLLVRTDRGIAGENGERRDDAKDDDRGPGDQAVARLLPPLLRLLLLLRSLRPAAFREELRRTLEIAAVALRPGGGRPLGVPPIGDRRERQPGKQIRLAALVALGRIDEPPPGRRRR